MLLDLGERILDGREVGGRGAAAETGGDARELRGDLLRRAGAEEALERPAGGRRGEEPAIAVGGGEAHRLDPAAEGEERLLGVVQVLLDGGLGRRDAGEQLPRPGARGKATWSAERPEKYKDNEHIVLVRATVDRIGRSGSKHQVVLDWIHNRQTEKIDLERVTVDGEEQSLVGGALQFLLLQMD